MICNNCGNEIENGSNFCPYCGSHVVNEAANIQQPMNNMPNNATYMEQMPTALNKASVTQPQNSKDNKALLIIIVVFIFSLIVGTVCFIVCKILGQLPERIGTLDGTTSEQNERENYELEKDSIYSGMDENMVSEDLIAWLNATYAIQTDANELDLTVIGGMQPDDSNVGLLEDGLSAGWGINNKEDLVQTVGKLVTDDGDPNNDGWDYSRAEELLAHGYCIGWFDLGEYLGYAVPIGKKIQGRFKSWDEFGDNYVTHYMSWVSNGGLGFAGDINQRCMSHQLFVTGAEYYYGPYAVDFDMQLGSSAIASYYNSMDRNKEIPSEDDKISELVKGYIAPTELGIKTTSGIVQIDGDLYQMPAPVKAFWDNGWELDESGKNAILSWNKNTELTFKRNGKELVLDAHAFANTSGAVENGYVDRLDIEAKNGIEYVLPGGITTSSTHDEVVAALRAGNSGEFKKGNNGSIEISLAGRTEQYSTSNINFCFDNDKKISTIFYHCFNSYADSAESTVRNVIYDDLDQTINDANNRKAYLDAKYGGSGKEAPVMDELSPYELVIGNEIYNIDKTVDEIVESGWVIDDPDYSESIVVEPGKNVVFLMHYKGIDGAGAFYGFYNNSDSSVNITDAKFNIFHVYESIWRVSSYLPIKTAKGMSFGNSYSDIVANFGEPQIPDIDQERQSRHMTAYDYETQDGKVRFMVFDDDKTVGDIVLLPN
ncbi:MAG: DUF1266 domain-containing protein [Butyrivibrio sp.]|nr:DUF1266 domain-containing protein [Butyrivibrio sp.]